jgi:hypothetical protein
LFVQQRIFQAFNPALQAVKIGAQLVNLSVINIRLLAGVAGFFLKIHGIQSECLD